MSDAELRADNQRVVRDYLEAINRWDFDRMREIVHEDLKFTQMFAPKGLQKHFHSREELIGLQESLTSQIITENLHEIVTDTFASDPNRVIVTYRSEMQMADPEMSYGNEYVSFFTVEDGLITTFVEYFDSVRLVEGFGGTVESPEIK